MKIISDDILEPVKVVDFEGKESVSRVLGDDFLCFERTLPGGRVFQIAHMADQKDKILNTVVGVVFKVNVYGPVCLLSSFNGERL